MEGINLIDFCIIFRFYLNIQKYYAKIEENPSRFIEGVNSKGQIIDLENREETPSHFISKE